MHRASIPVAVLTIALATSVFAAPTLPGVNIRWDDCFADGGVMNKTFACDTNTGSNLALMSFQLDTGMDHVSGVEIAISLKSTEPTLPAWWEFQNSGSCRLSSLSYIPSPLLSGSCVDWGEGIEVGGFPLTGYHLGEMGPGSAVAHMIAAVPQSTLMTLDAGTEYVVGALSLNHAKTVGAGSCGGCDTPVCILFTALKVSTSVPPAADRLFTQGANGVSSQIIHWQNGQLTNLVNHCSGTFNCTTQFDCLAVTPTAARRSTWGDVKSLYR